MRQHLRRYLGRRVPTAAVLSAFLISAITAELAAQSPRHIVRDRNGLAVCAITIPTSRASKPDDDRLVIDIRVPDAPGAGFLAKLPAEKRDYSALPIRVLLVPTPGNEQDRARTALQRVRPLSADFTPRQLSLNAKSGADTFVRIEYARAELRSGVDVVAERSAVATDGQRITAQTRCRIGVIDALVWR